MTHTKGHNDKNCIDCVRKDLLVEMEQNAELLEALVDIVFSADGPKEYKNECHAQYWVSAPRIERAREAIQKARE